MELVIVPVTVIPNFVWLSRTWEEGYFSGGKRTITYVFTVNINCWISSCVIPRYCHVCPNVQRNLNATLNEVPPIIKIVTFAMATKSNLLVSKKELKLPWILPVIIKRTVARYKATRWFYPTGNGKTPAIEIDYRSSGEGIWSVEDGGLASWTPPFDIGWITTETEIRKETSTNKQYLPI